MTSTLACGADQCKHGSSEATGAGTGAAVHTCCRRRCRRSRSPTVGISTAGTRTRTAPSHSSLPEAATTVAAGGMANHRHMQSTLDQWPLQQETSKGVPTHREQLLPSRRQHELPRRSPLLKRPLEQRAMRIGWRQRRRLGGRHGGRWGGDGRQASS